MSRLPKQVDVAVHCADVHQRIDGFGVNINSKPWNGGRLKPVVDFLVDDLGATLFRLDAYGKSNWVDPRNEHDASVLSQASYDRVYAGEEFASAAGMGAHLNARGIEPYLTLSGVVPRWMCGADGVSLARHDLFAEMAVSYARWARQAGIRFRLFGPLNETDLGPPEGPKMPPAEFVKAAEAVVDRLDACDLGDVKLVLAEQSGANLDYLGPILASRRLRGRVGAFGFHIYGDERLGHVVDAVRRSDFRNCPVWMTEYGDLDQTGEREWPLAWTIFGRLMTLLEDGFAAALNWDAYDNYHDHDQMWSIYGLVRTGCFTNGRLPRVPTYTPKKRYYACRQVYRFVRPGFVRVEAAPSCDAVRAIAFTIPDGADMTVVGMNEGTHDAVVRLRGEGIDNRLSGRMDVHRTSAAEDCIRAATVHALGQNLAEIGVRIDVPAESIFTATTVRPECRGHA